MIQVITSALPGIGLEMAKIPCFCPLQETELPPKIQESTPDQTFLFYRSSFFIYLLLLRAGIYYLRRHESAHHIMALRTFVKVSSITNLSDARYCAGMGVDMLGFSLDPSSPDFVSEKVFKEIIGWVAGVKIVGELGNVPVEEAADLLTRYPVDYLQTSHSEAIPLLSALNIPLILCANFLENSQSSLKEICETSRPFVDLFLLESENIVLTEFEISFLRRLSAKYPLLLGFGFSHANIQFLLDEIPVKGIALRGTQEIKPGLKDFDELAEVLEAIETED
jgi:phosphoribosylanthranilate isomerase